MDSTSFPRPFFPHVVPTSSLHRSYVTHPSARFGLWKSRAWNKAFCVVRFSAAGIEFDDSNLKRNYENGSLLAGALNESFGTLDSEITPETNDFFVSDAEGDPDCPSKGYSSIEQALDALRQGKFVIVVDDENDGVEGNLVKVASLTSTKDVAFMIKHGSGIVSVGMKENDLQRLDLPLMSPETEDEDSSAPTFTIIVDAKCGTSTGVSAEDSAKTVIALSSPRSKSEDFRKPGHVFPLKYRNGGVLRRAGHTETSIDLVELAGFPPFSVLTTLVDVEDGSMASLPSLRKLALECRLPIVSITDLISIFLNTRLELHFLVTNLMRSRESGVIMLPD